VKLVLPALLALPAASVATALTLMEPSPRVVRSALLRTTACAEPVPVTVFVTVLLPRVKVTTVLAPLSALTVTAPPAAVASALVAPSATPVPSAKVGATGAAVSKVKLLVPALLALPAASVAPPAANSGITVPALQPVIVTVRDAPESVPGAKAHDAAVPVFEKSPAATPVTDSENVSV
jgi:hypothetical protein